MTRGGGGWRLPSPSPLVRFLTVRVGGVLAILVVVSIATFALLTLAPGDVVKNLLGTRPATPATIAAIRAEYHLDDPAVTQYIAWLGRALTGDFGTSTHLQTTVADAIGARLGMTAALVLIAFVITIAVAVPVGVFAALRPGGVLDRAATIISLVGLAAPSFAVGLALLFVFAYWLPIFPVFGGGSGPADTLVHLVLPAATLSIGLGAIVVRLTRTAMLHELGADHVLFARARGVAQPAVVLLALRNAAIPISTGSGLVLSYMVGGTIIVETIFGLPGIGLLLQEAVEYKDMPVVQAVTLLIAAVIAVVALLVDIGYLLLDPRVRVAGERG